MLFMEWVDISPSLAGPQRFLWLLGADDNMLITATFSDQNQPLGLGNSPLWRFRQVALPTSGDAGPYRIGFTFNSGGPVISNGKGWFIDKLVVVAP